MMILMLMMIPSATRGPSLKGILSPKGKSEKKGLNQDKKKIMMQLMMSSTLGNQKSKKLNLMGSRIMESNTT